MAKQEHEQQSNQLNLTVVALVALVAIVGLVALVMNAASIGKVATGSQMASAEEGGVFIPFEEGNVAGNAFDTAGEACARKYAGSGMGNVVTNCGQYFGRPAV